MEAVGLLVELDLNEMFGAALGLAVPWRVVSSPGVGDLPGLTPGVMVCVRGPSCSKEFHCEDDR